MDRVQAKHRIVSLRFRGRGRNLRGGPVLLATHGQCPRLLARSARSLLRDGHHPRLRRGPHVSPKGLSCDPGRRTGRLARRGAAARVRRCLRQVPCILRSSLRGPSQRAPGLPSRGASLRSLPPKQSHQCRLRSPNNSLRPFLRACCPEAPVLNPRVAFHRQMDIVTRSVSEGRTRSQPVPSLAPAAQLQKAPARTVQNVGSSASLAVRASAKTTALAPRNVKTVAYSHWLPRKRV